LNQSMAVVLPKFVLVSVIIYGRGLLSFRLAKSPNRSTPPSLQS